MKKAAFVGIFVFCVMSFLGLGLISYTAIQTHRGVDARNEALGCLAAKPQTALQPTRNDAAAIDAAASGCADAAVVAQQELATFRTEGPASANLAAWRKVVEATKLLGLIVVLAGLGAFAIVYFSMARVERAAQLAGHTTSTARSADNSKS